MTFAAVTFIALFAMIVSIGLLVGERGFSHRSLAALAGAPGGTRRSWWQRMSAASSLQSLASPLSRLVPRTESETSGVRRRLMRAGFRTDGAVTILFAARVLTPIVVLAAIYATPLSTRVSPLVAVISAGVAYLSPEYVLDWLVRRRKLEIRLALPDALDMMVVCIEAGLSLDQAALRTADEIALASPELADELNLINLEQRAGKPRADSWLSFADRSDLEPVRTFVAVLIQADQFGTSMSRALRTYSDTLRMQRRQAAEEQAAKTTVKLVFPLVIFIFPSLFIVTLGPAMLSISETFEKYFNR